MRQCLAWAAALVFGLGVEAGCAGKTPEASSKASAKSTGPSDGDVVAYRITEGGRVVGRLHSRYSEPEGRRQLVSRVVLGAARKDGSIIPVRTVEYATTLRTDFTPVAYKRLSSRDGRLNLIFRGGRIAKTTDLDAKEIPVGDAPAATPFSSDDVAALTLLLMKSGLTPGNSGRFEVRVPDTAQVENPPVQVFADGQRRTVLQMTLGRATFAADGWVDKFEGSDGRIYERLAEPGEQPNLLAIPEPLAYERPSLAAWRDRELLVDVAGGQLAGTLSVPRETSQWKSGMAPAVIFASDLPLQNRHGFTTAVDYGTWGLLDALAEAGFAVFRVDDRGVGNSKVDGTAAKDDLPTAVADMMACLEAVKRQPNVDPDRAIVIGHGFGARVAVEIAASSDLVAVVLLAPAYRTPSAVLGEPLVQIAETDPDLAERRMRLVLQAIGGSEAAQGQSSPDDIARYQPVADRLLDYAKQDVPALLQKVEEPIAVFQGMRDFEISWQRDAKALVDAVNARRRRQAKLFVYELVDHHLKTESGKSTPERYMDKGRTLDPDLLKNLTGWMTEQVQGKR